jgi:ketosteroid isomerase-like protein
VTHEEIEELVRVGYARLNRGDRDASGARELASLDVWHPEAVYVNSADDPDPGVHNGIEAVRRQVGRWVEAYPDLQVEPLEILSNDDVAFVWVRFSGHGAGSGVPMEMELAQVISYEDRKVRRLEEYPTRDAGLAAAGLAQ